CLNGNYTVVGTIGSLKYEKGHEYLLRAAKEVLESHTSVKFLIVGSGPLRNSLENNVKSLGIANDVIFTGYRKDVAELLSVMDIFVLPSVKEGLPMVLLEAMAAKKPIIATRVGAVPKVIRDNETGILVEPEDVYTLQRAIGNFLDDIVKAHGLALEGYERVKKDFSSEKMCRAYLTLYRELLSQ
ncbi:MAG: glycosyltransferase, partial [Nitrospirota bacterium]|nr:glycosyltransferase [Nitrospirota bacterium]